MVNRGELIRAFQQLLRRAVLGVHAVAIQPPLQIAVEALCALLMGCQTGDGYYGAPPAEQARGEPCHEGDEQEVGDDGHGAGACQFFGGI